METVTRRIRKSAGVIAAVLACTCCFSWTVPARGETARTQVSDSAQTDPGSFEKAVESFYSESAGLTDTEILEAARKISSDTSVLYSGLGGVTAPKAAEAVAAYEQSKADYITAAINAASTGSDVPADPEDKRKAEEDASNCFRAADGIREEWDRQGRYARMLIAEGTSIRELIPRYQVTSCSEKDGILEIGVEEWMTQGYGSRDGTGAVNASAYRYVFTLSLQKTGEGSFRPCGINGTEINYTWLLEGQDPVRETQDAPQTLYPILSDLDTQVSAYARIAADDTGQEAFSFSVDKTAAAVGAADASGTELPAFSGKEGGAELSAAAAGAYTYSPKKTADYADKYWKNYNRKYREYRGVDCANFVSQCLYAGGMPLTDDWYPQSVNWINVMGHISHFKAFGSFVTASNANVLKGNPVYYDWNGNGVYDHVAVCVGTNSSGMPVVDAHTNDVYHVPWSMGSSGRRGTIVLRRNGGNKDPENGPRNTWQTVDGKVYYIGPDGKRVVSRFMTIDGKRYYFYSSGVRASGFFKVSGKWYYASTLDGHLLKGWQTIDGKTYYLKKKDYSRITAGRHELGGATYYFNSKGVRQVSFIKIGEKWYYADKKTGKFITGWRKIHGEWYYFDKKTMVKA
ncbi:MAG: amidase domain-containing protein, partial [Eubacteriales bacterium]|nr:amidase domain-containing protein [Eubacteriales bacterium]